MVDSTSSYYAIMCLKESLQILIHPHFEIMAHFRNSWKSRYNPPVLLNDYNFEHAHFSLQLLHKTNFHTRPKFGTVHCSRQNE